MSGASAGPQIVIIAAVADNGVIGADGELPWRLKSDLKRLRALTIGRPIVMGRKTFESFPRRPLPGRTNIVVTRDRGFRGPGAVVTTSLSDALLLARADALRRSVAEIAVIGGTEIYAQCLDVADRLELTEVHARPGGDTCFPAIEKAQWEEVARVAHPAGPDDSAAFTYVTYCRRAAH